jgi:beta-glucosidase
MKNQIHLFFSIACFSFLFQSCNSGPNLKIDTNNYQKKVDSLIKIMTFDEKIGQLNLLASGWDVTGPVMDPNYKQLIKQGKVGAIFNAYKVDYVADLQRLAVEETRLGIPLLFGYDVIHGYRTIFPIPLAQSCTWDLAMIEHSDRIAASEATAEGINWAFAPMVDISRDPRWGRVSEGAGEDTWLGSKIAAARVRGFQGESIYDERTLLACMKHFAAYGAPQAGRDYHTVDISERSLLEYYLPPFKACVDAGVASVMTSFNEISGVPSSSNHWLYTDLLRDSWGFKGFVVTDYTSIYELIPHGVAEDSAHAGELALNAGIQLDMQSSIYLKNLKNLVATGKVNETLIDKAVSDILTAKYKLGLFDDPYRYCNKTRQENEIMTQESKDFARQMVTKSCVLLKNDNQTLPIPASVKKIALIGPLGDADVDMLGNWSATGLAQNCVTLLDGLKSEGINKNIQVHFVKGCNVNDDSTYGFNDAIKAAKNADYVILALGEHRNMSGEAASRTNLDLPGVQLHLAEKIIELGKPTAVILFNGRPLTIPELNKKAPAILEAWFGGVESGNGIADLLFGKAVPSGKLTMTFPLNVGQIPIHYNMKNNGRPVDPTNPEYQFRSKYLDSPNEPLFPFGYGLSYTTFEYSDLKLSASEITNTDTLLIQARITNTGNFDGEEIVQLYVHDLVGSVTRPVKELKGFSKVFLTKGESKTVTIKLTTNDLRFYTLDMLYAYEPGKFEVYIGPNSSTGLKDSFLVK